MSSIWLKVSSFHYWWPRQTRCWLYRRLQAPPTWTLGTAFVKRPEKLHTCVTIDTHVTIFMRNFERNTFGFTDRSTFSPGGSDKSVKEEAIRRQGRKEVPFLRLYWEYSWHVTSQKSTVYDMMAWYTHKLWRDYHTGGLTHPSPHTIVILLWWWWEHRRSTLGNFGVYYMALLTGVAMLHIRSPGLPGLTPASVCP